MSDYWAPAQHKVGDRVRIRLSTECPNVVPPNTEHPEAQAVIPHHPISDGQMGSILRHDPVWEPHPWLVVYVPDGARNTSVSSHFAAVELVPLSPRA